MTLVGTIRDNRTNAKQFISDMLNKKVSRYSSQILRNKLDTTLTLYKAKPNKIVSILSSHHATVSISNESKKKPETVLFYSHSKCGVDSVSQMVKHFSTKSASRRWPLAVFYNLLDMAAINAWILYRECTGSNTSRRNFLLELAEELVTKKITLPQERKKKLCLHQ